MAYLAIKEHETRGKEVIEILEILGGHNSSNLFGYRPELVYFITDSGDIDCRDINYILNNYFTLEEFEENFPYKVGDKVRLWSQDDDEFFYGSYSYESKTIKSMQWNEIRGKVAYTIEGIDRVFYKEELKPYKEKVNMKENKVNYDIKEGAEKNYPPKTQAEVDKYLQEHPIKNAMNVMDIETCLETDGLKLSENVVINSKGIGSIQFIQWYEKTKYPKTYEECCEVLGSDPSRIIVLSNRKDIIHEENKHCYEMYNIYQLLICRDAYWKIAGDWKPEFIFGKKKYCIMTKDNKVISATVEETNRILVFPTAEMRDEFYNNFKDLIDNCKELL